MTSQNTLCDAETVSWALGYWLKTGGALSPGIQPDRATELTWLDALQDLPAADVATAVRDLARNQPGVWLTPAAIRAQIRWFHRENNLTSPRCPAHEWEPATNCVACRSEHAATNQWPTKSLMGAYWQTPARQLPSTTWGPSSEPPSPAPEGLIPTQATPLPERKPGRLPWPDPHVRAQMPPEQRQEIEARMRAVAVREDAPPRTQQRRPARPGTDRAIQTLTDRVTALEQQTNTRHTDPDSLSPVTGATQSDLNSELVPELGCPEIMPSAWRTAGDAGPPQPETADP
jgi:hypothetical protein